MAGPFVMEPGLRERLKSLKPGEVEYITFSRDGSEYVILHLADFEHLLERLGMAAKSIEGDDAG